MCHIISYYAGWYRYCVRPIDALWGHASNVRLGFTSSPAKVHSVAALYVLLLVNFAISWRNTMNKLPACILHSNLCAANVRKHISTHCFVVSQIYAIHVVPPLRTGVFVCSRGHGKLVRVGIVQLDVRA